MTTNTLSSLQRLLLIVGAAMLIPAVVIVAWLLREASFREIAAVERNSLAAADVMLLLMDARSSSDIASLRVLSSSQSFSGQDVQAGTMRALEAINFNAGWKAVRLNNRMTGNTILQAVRDGSSAILSETSKQTDGDVIETR